MPLIPIQKKHWRKARPSRRLGTKATEKFRSHLAEQPRLPAPNGRHMSGSITLSLVLMWKTGEHLNEGRGKNMKKLAGIIGVTALGIALVCGVSNAAVLLSDDFSSGSINTSKWNPKLINYFGDPIAAGTSMGVDNTGGNYAAHGLTSSRDASILDSVASFGAAHYLTFDIMRASNENAPYYASYYMGSGNSNQMLYGIDFAANGTMVIHAQQGTAGWANWNAISIVSASYDTWYTVSTASTSSQAHMTIKERATGTSIYDGTFNHVDPALFHSRHSYMTATKPVTCAADIWITSS